MTYPLLQVMLALLGVSFTHSLFEYTVRGKEYRWVTQFVFQGGGTLMVVLAVLWKD